MTDRAIILAAGKGERLVSGFDFPKPLKRVAGTPLIVRVLRGLEAMGVGEVCVVVGYLGDVLKQGLARYRFDLEIRYAQNAHYEKPNGSSLLCASDFVAGPTFLLMSDHLWAPSLFRAVATHPIVSDEVVLGVDPRTEKCFDLDDATKVHVEGGRVTSIGKELACFNAIDTGVFRITPALIDALREADGPTGCSLSQGVATLAARGKVRAADIGEAFWIDVDTPEAHAEAERLLSSFGDALTPLPPRAAAGA